ncbi:MAG: hypothetical protein AWU54_912 [Candidatus Frackibacter sp. T328-2]|nr:MAG: hypothetical protein AWU54_912 [Candidatus Frackibacter sp. T328-2]
MKKLSSLLVLMLVMSILVVPVQAKDINLMSAGTPNAKIDTSAIKLESVDYRLGIRSVDVSGNEDMYKHDIGLNDGVRLLNLDVTLVPENDGVDKYFDLVRFSLGDIADPTPTYGIRVKEYGLYDFGVKRTEREYYYNDASLDTQVAATDDPNTTEDETARNEYDLTEYDFTRTKDSMHLSIAPEGLPKIFIARNRLEKEGIAKLPQEVYSLHAEYQMNTFLNQVNEDTTLGTEFSYAGFDVYLAHTQDSYNASPLQVAGEPFDSTNDPIADDNGVYRNKESRSLDRQVDQLSIHKVFNNKLDVTLDVKDTRGNGSFSTNGYIDAIAGPHGAYPDGTDFEAAKTAFGQTKVDSFVGSIDATYVIANETYLHSGYKKTETENYLDYYAYAEDGNPWPPTTGGTDNSQSYYSKSFYNYKDKYYLTGEHYFNNNLKVELGYLSNEEEDKSVNGVGEITEDGYKLSTFYSPTEAVTVNVDYKDTTMDEDGTEVADNNEVDVKVGWEVVDNLTLTSKYKKEVKDGSHYGAYLGYPAGHYKDGKKESESQTFSVNYQPLANLDLGFTYGNQTYETKNGFMWDPYGANTLESYTTTMDNDMYNLNVAYQVNDQFNATFHGNFVDGTETFSTTNEAFKNTYNDYGLKLTQAVPSYENMNVTLDARHVKYDEEESTIGAYGTDANDYSADIITLGLEGGF